MKKEFYDEIYRSAREYIAYLREHPEELSGDVRNSAINLLADFCNALGFSEHSAWGVSWKILKRHSENDAEPYETITRKLTPQESAQFVGNVILNGGANEMLKLVFGIKPATPYDTENARIYVGTDSTAERADQKGVLALGSNQAVARMDSGYPQVPAGGRTAIVQATFGDSAANFEWNEVSLTNGQGGSSVALNRKQANMGTKNGGVWTVRLEVSIVEVS